MLNINKADLCELRVLKKPSDQIINVMSAISILLHDKVVSWDEFKGHLADPDQFIKKLDEYDARQVTASMKEKLKAIVECSEFDVESTKKASEAASLLCEWVLGVYSSC